jgi:uncharacterized protein YbaR (Trm112 family)
MNFNDRETAMVLYALRKVQESLKTTDLSNNEGHFAEVESLNADEIEDLCERINCDGDYDSEPVDSFNTTCPYCKTEDQLFVVRAKLMATGDSIKMNSPLGPDGFEVVLPEGLKVPELSPGYEDYSTEDEIVQCAHCKKTFPLDEVTL